MQIKKLKIYSSQINTQIDFYGNVLGLEVLSFDKNQALFAIGTSILQVEYAEMVTPYHYAINIPANKSTEALEWLRSKTEILKDGASEIQDFNFWNAEAIYFYDKDQNIVEFIARRNLKNFSDKEFSVHQLIEISEIGVPSTDIERQFYQLQNMTNIEIYDGGFERFCAIGDERGLFICINKNIKNWFPTNDKAFSSPFEIEFIEQGVTHRIVYENESFKKRELD